MSVSSGFNPTGGRLLGDILNIRVLVADDFEPFRRFLSSTLQYRADLQVICEVSDGLEAVQKATELQPDLILLDIGLPKLNGIEAARTNPQAFPSVQNSIREPRIVC